jgi:amino acid transporter
MLRLVEVRQSCPVPRHPANPSYAISLAAELSAAALIIQYWTDLSPAIWITVCFVPIIVLNYLPVNFYGEVEVVTCSIKVVALVG